MRLSYRTRLAASALALLSSACSDSPAAPAAQSADLTSVLSELSLGTALPSSFSSGVPMASLDLVPSSCTYDGSQSFICPTVTANGLTITNSFTLLTAAGAPQSAFDANATAAVRATGTVRGAMTFGTDVTNIDAHQTMTLSGLLTSNHVIDGTQDAHLTGTIAGTRMDETMVTTIVGLVPPAHAGPGNYPRAGTITISSFDANSKYGNSTIVMSFNGTSKVTVTFTGFGSSERCIVDLAVVGSGALTACTTI